MEKTNIGFKAGIILEKIRRNGLITIAELARRLNFAADETALAAGWLARENKIYNRTAKRFAVYQERVIQRIKRINDKTLECLQCVTLLM